MEPVVASSDELEAGRHDDYLAADSARLTLEPNGFVEIDRSARRTRLMLDHEAGADELVHPGLATTGATVAWWQDRVALHGCAVTNGSSAIAFLGEREDGKSSTLTWFVKRGWGAVSDDVLVIDGASVLAGPRSVDLRLETSSAWGIGTHVGKLGTRDRWRFAAGQVDPVTPLAAVVVLGWGPDVQVTRVPPAERLPLLLERLTLPVAPRDQRALLRLLAVPVHRLVRPRDVSRIDSSLELLLAGIDSGQQRGL